MSVVFNAATAANVSILRTTNELFQITQKRVSTGKSVFGAADDATRYKMSEAMIGRSSQLQKVNNNISIALQTLEATDKTLKQMIGAVEAAQDLARKAQAEGAAGVRGANPTANIAASTVVGGSVSGDRLSITSDGGKNFTYTFQNNTTTWGQVADALNAANIGVAVDFIPAAAAGQTNIRFVSTNGYDFTFDAISDEGVMGNLGGLASPTAQTFTPNNLFTAGAVTPLVNETGFTIAFGGHVTGSRTTTLLGADTITAGATLVFEDGNGQARTFVAGATETVSSMITAINGMNAGVKMELVNQGGGAVSNLRIRNINRGAMKILAGTSDLAANGAIWTPNTTTFRSDTGYAAPLSNNNVLRMRYGQQYDSIITNLNLMVTNNPVVAGRNLLAGQNLAAVMDEFAGNPITVTGVNITAAGTLTMAQAGTTWTTDANIQASATQSNQALINLREFQAQFATFTSYMKDRYDLNRSYATDLKTLGDDLVSADVAEESARLTALQTQQQFAVQAFSAGSQNAQSLLRLLS
jgi:flagellin